MEDLSLKIEATRKAIDELKKNGEHESLSRQTELLQLSLKIEESKQRETRIDTPVHAYSKHLLLDDGDQGCCPPSNVRQKMARLCQTQHRFDVQTTLLEMVTNQCSDMVRCARKNIQDLEDEYVDMEVAILKEIAMIDEEMLACKKTMEALIQSQKAQLHDLKCTFDDFSVEEESISEPSLGYQEEGADENGRSEVDFGDWLIGLISAELKNEECSVPKKDHLISSNVMSMSFRNLSDDLKTELTVRGSQFNLSPTMSFRSISDYFSPRKGTDNMAVMNLRDSFARLDSERFPSVRFAPAVPVACE